MSENNFLSFVVLTDLWVQVILLLTIFNLIYYLIRSKNDGFKLPPGPHGYPFIGFLPNLLDNKPYEVLDKYAKQYGEIYSLKIAGKLYIVLNSYEVIRAAYVDDGTNFNDRPQDFTMFGKFFEFKAMPFLNGDEWKIHRKILSSWFKAGNNQANLEGSVAQTARNLTDKIRALDSKPVDLYPFFANAAMDIIGSLVWGERLATTQPETAKLILTDMRRLFSLTPAGEVVISGGLANLIYNPFTRKRKEFKQIHDRQVSLMHQFIEEHLATLEPGRSRDYIDAFINARETSGSKGDLFDKTALVVNMLALFVAGTDTSSSALYFATYLMAKHPEIQARCQAELDTNIGERTLEYSDRKRLPYIEATLNEVYRYAAIGAVPQPRSNHSRTNLLGYDIPANTTCVTNLWTSTHDARHFSNPNNFDPDNFFEKDMPRELSSLPFSAGKRNCPGEQLARLDIFMIFTSLLQDFYMAFPKEHATEYAAENFLPGFTRVLAPFRIMATPR